jgi:hypothetical protein
MTKKQKYFYAMYDSFLGLNPRSYGKGFANAKTAAAFRSKADRDEFLETTKDLTARAITRAEAMAFATPCIVGIGVRMTDNEYDADRYVSIIAKKDDGLWYEAC